MEDDSKFDFSKNMHDISKDECKNILGFGVPVHRFKLNGGLKSKWLKSGMFEKDIEMENKVNKNIKYIFGK